jgi:hypothetical protein
LKITCTNKAAPPMALILINQDLRLVYATLLRKKLLSKQDFLDIERKPNKKGAFIWVCFLPWNIFNNGCQAVQYKWGKAKLTAIK